MSTTSLLRVVRVSAILHRICSLNVGSLKTTAIVLCALGFIFCAHSKSLAQQYYATDDYWIIDFRTPTIFPASLNDHPVGAGGYTIVTPPTGGNAFWYDYFGTIAYNPHNTTDVYSDSITYKNCLPVNGQEVCTNTATITILVIGTGDSSNLGCYCPRHLPAPSAPKEAVGNPINVTNGNMWLNETDYNLPGSARTSRSIDFTTANRRQAGFLVSAGQPNMTSPSLFMMVKWYD